MPYKLCLCLSLLRSRLLRSSQPHIEVARLTESVSDADARVSVHDTQANQFSSTPLRAGERSNIIFIDADDKPRRKVYEYLGKAMGQLATHGMNLTVMAAGFSDSNHLGRPQRWQVFRK